MEKLAIVAGLAALIALAVLKLVQLLQWTRCTATFDGLPGNWLGITATGQKLPITFRAKDGTEIHATLRKYSKGMLPPAGAELRILYDPDDPARVEWAASLLFLALLAALLLAVMESVIVQMV